jgi:RNA polymerase sigma-70 factor (ECF subfamily)
MTCVGHADAELMRRWQRGDAAAVTALVDRWQQPVARFLMRISSPPDSVPDLCQEVFLRVIQAAPRYRESGHFSTWLFQIALNVARDAARRGRREPITLPDLECSGSADDTCEKQELARAMSKAVAELPPPQREVMALRHDQDMTFEEIAQVLNTPASTLKSRFTAALHRLRARLAEQGFDFEETER